MPFAYELGRQLVKRAGLFDALKKWGKPPAPAPVSVPQLKAPGGASLAKYPDVQRIPVRSNRPVNPASPRPVQLQQALQRDPDQGVLKGTMVTPEFRKLTTPPILPDNSLLAHSLLSNYNSPVARTTQSLHHELGPRAELYYKLQDAHGDWPVNSQDAPRWSAAGSALLRERLKGQAVPVRWLEPDSDTAGYAAVSGGRPHIGLPDRPPSTGLITEPDKWLDDYTGTLNHEHEHLQQRYPETGYSPETGLLAPTVPSPAFWAGNRADIHEVAPTLGDLVFMAETARQTNGKPVSAAVDIPTDARFGTIRHGNSDFSPNYNTYNADWMARQAREHGYFAGRSMQDLLQTPEGMSFVARMMGHDGYTPPPPKFRTYAPGQAPFGRIPPLDLPESLMPVRGSGRGYVRNPAEQIHTTNTYNYR